MENEKSIKIIKPQPGAQEDFLASRADVVVYGGAAGSGKTFSVLLEPLHYIDVEGFNTVFFRRTTPQITAPGGLWDEATKLYRPLNATMIKQPQLKASFEKSKVEFRSLQYESDVYNWQGSQICLIVFDELTHFSSEMFFYMLSRNRSVCGIKPYVRATCNPDPDSWLASFIAWWIDQETGYPIPERSGMIRFFIRVDGQIYWCNTKKGLHKYIDLSPDDVEAGICKDDLIKSFTFIPASIYDNKELLKANPSYLASLKALPEVEKERLLYGNWKIKRAQGDYFKREWFRFISPPAAHEISSIYRGWDRAATEKNDTNNPDFTAGVMIAKLKDDSYCILDARRFRERPGKRNQLIINTAMQDKERYSVSKSILEQDPGQAGVDEIESLLKLFTNNGLLAEKVKVSKNKVTRALPLSAASQNGLVSIVRGEWNESFFLELEQFGDNPKDYSHDDMIDGASAAFNRLNSSASSYDLSNLISI